MTVVLPKKRASGQKAQNFTLNATQAADMEVFLNETPKGEVVMTLPNGTTQIQGSDFAVDGNRVYWGGLALETILDEGDKLVILF